MDNFQRATLRRMADTAQVLAASEPATTRTNDDAHIADLIDSQLRSKDMPDAARREHDDISRSQGPSNHGGIYVPLHRLMGRAWRDLVTGTATSTAKGGNLIGVKVAMEPSSELAAFPAVIRAGATVLPNMRENARLPLLSTGAAAEFVNENTAPTESAPMYSSVTMTPHTATAFVDIGRRLLLQAAPDMIIHTRTLLERGIARLIDRAALVGTGASGEPTGIVGTSGVASIATPTNGGAPWWAMVQDCYAALADANVITPESRLAFLANSKTIAKCMKVSRQAAGAEGSFLYEPAGDGMNGHLGGWPCHLANNLPATGTKGTGTNLSTLVFGDWSKCYIALWGNAVEIVVDPFSQSTKGVSRVRAYLDMDVQLPNPEAFCAVTGLVTA